MESLGLTACSPMSAYKQNDLEGCMCLNHWGSVSSSDLATISPWTDDTEVHILQPDEFCNPSSAGSWPFCRAQSFENGKIGCDCQVWPEDNSFEPYQLNNPCLAYPIPTTAAAKCTFVSVSPRRKRIHGFLNLLTPGSQKKPKAAIYWRPTRTRS